MRSFSHSLDVFASSPETMKIMNKVWECVGRQKRGTTLEGVRAWGSRLVVLAYCFASVWEDSKTMVQTCRFWSTRLAQSLQPCDLRSSIRQRLMRTSSKLLHYTSNP